MPAAIQPCTNDGPAVVEFHLAGTCRGAQILDQFAIAGQREADRVARVETLDSFGIEQARLEAHGYGLEKPTADNNTEEGRTANRRVEFNIVKEEDTNAAPKK